MNSSQKFLMFIAAFFMKVCAGDSVLNLDTVELSEITPPTTYTVPTNPQISRANREDAEILSIFIGIDDTDRDLVAELSSSRVNNNGILSAKADESAAQKIANRVPTPYFIKEEVTAIHLNASAKLSASCAAAAIEEENSTTSNAVANPQTDVVSGWPWWYQWLSSFIS
jgi:hypothetical protein